MLEKSLNIEDYDDKKIKSDINSFAKDTINDVEQKTKMINYAVNGITNISDIESSLENNLDSLEIKIKKLYPSDLDFLKKKNSFIFNPIKRYFNNIKKEEIVFSNLITDIDKEKNIMKNDNITLGIECERLKNIIEILEKEIEKGEEYKKIIKNTIGDEKSKNDLLDKLEKKIIDLKEILIVKQQSLLAIELVIKNNEEIIRNITRIKNVTLEALNTAILVAHSLYNQKIVLKRIEDLKKSDENVWKATNSNLKEYQKNKVSIEELKLSFDNVIDTVNEVKNQNNKSFPENEIKILELKKEKN